MSVVGTIIAVLLVAASVITIALYAHSTDGAETDCEVFRSIFFEVELEISDRTAGVGLSCACLSFLVAVLAIPLWIAGSFLPKTLHLVCRIVLLVLSILLTLYFVPAWALLSEDIDDRPSNCDTPESWGAALALALFTDIFWFAHTIFTIVALFVEGCTPGGFFLPE